MLPPMLQIVRAGTEEGRAAIQRLLRRATAAAAEVEAGARAILDDVRARGDAAVREATVRFEGRELETLELDRDSWVREAQRVEPEVRATIERAHARIRAF